MQIPAMTTDQLTLYHFTSSEAAWSIRCEGRMVAMSGQDAFFTDRLTAVAAIGHSTRSNDPRGHLDLSESTLPGCRHEDRRPPGESRPPDHPGPVR
ncbi:hypothetical protein VV01_21515 [Luteipulveratus halotolerans]|uniref:DUF1508 domain-containing protein n=1 Tax=Luteipulveratus halotolerans TaxID=1631356 RepID=A0A0L6CDU4_9MICO|nr:hypothetical protein VV01_21515 [Luteipulveratus halotolerans]